MSGAGGRTLTLTGVRVLHEWIRALIRFALALADLLIIHVPAAAAAIVLRTFVLVMVEIGTLTHWPVRCAIRAIPALAQLGARLGRVCGALFVERQALLLHLVEVVVAAVHAFLRVPHHLLDVVLKLFAVRAAGERDTTLHALLPRFLDSVVRGNTCALNDWSNDGHVDLLPGRLDLLLDAGLDFFGAAGCLVTELGKRILGLKSLDGLGVHHLDPRLV